MTHVLPPLVSPLLPLYTVMAAITQGFWSMMWQSPLQKEMSDIRMQNLRNKTTLGHVGTFGVVKKLADKKKKAVYAGRSLPEDGLINTDVATRKSVLDSFAAITRQLCSVHHPNIVQMHGVFFHDSASYLPMLVYEKAVEWTLDCYLLENRREVDKVTILQHVARGLEYLHDQKPPILHLNLTAANVFVSQTDPRRVPVAKIADAGLTNLLITAGITTTQVKPQTIDYLPKEEKEKEWDTKVDVLCYGVLMGHVVVQETIIKTLPIFFGSSSDVDSFTAHLYERLQVHPLYNLLLKCLNRNGRARLTASEIRKHIDTHVSH